MIWLILGVLIWSIVHLYPSVAANHRNKLSKSMGTTYQGVYALFIITSIILIVIGWRISTPEQIYNPPVWGRHLTMLFILIAIVLFGAANTKSRIKQWVRHPMLMGMTVWSIGHLLANGDSKSLILFGGLGLWAVISQFTINKRDGAWVKPEPASGFKSDAILIVIALVIYGALLFAHPYISGMPLMPA